MKINIIMKLTAIFLIQLLCIMQLEACVFANTSTNTASHHTIINPEIQCTVLNLVTIEAFNKASLLKNKATCLIGNKILTGGIGGVEAADFLGSDKKEKLYLSDVLISVVQNSQRFYAYLHAAALRAPPLTEKHILNFFVKPNC